MRTLPTKSTKAERVFHELLKKHHIPFLFRPKILGREVDFLLASRIAVEIDGHPQDGRKTDLLYKAGYRVVHFQNRFVLNNRAEVEEQLLWLIHTKAQTSAPRP